MVNKQKKFTKLKPFDYQKSLANVDCGKYLDEMFDLAFMFSSGLSFKKITFSRHVAYLGGEKQEYILPKLAKCNIATSFDVWMFQGAYDIFPLVINILEANWQPKYFIIGFFEAT
jgi:hypothetical protein